MGALETKKQLVFLENTLGRCASADNEGNSNAAKLELSVSEGESSSLSGLPRQTEKHCHKTSPAAGLDQVNDEWDRILYLAGSGWKINSVNTADARLSSEVDLERLVRERNWFSVASFVEAGEM